MSSLASPNYILSYACIVFPVHMDNICMVKYKPTGSQTVLHIRITWEALKHTNIQDLFISIKPEPGCQSTDRALVL